MKIPESDWKWFGMAGHFICGSWCRFHLCTQVGPWLVSTVGYYVHPRHSAGSELKERDWLKDNKWGEEIGLDRKFETMVFKAGETCTCGCGQPRIDGSEVDFGSYDDPAEATAGHRKLCTKWSQQSA